MLVMKTEKILCRIFAGFEHQIGRAKPYTVAVLDVDIGKKEHDDGLLKVILMSFGSL